jgi:hypothetical protein
MSCCTAAAFTHRSRTEAGETGGALTKKGDDQRVVLSDGGDELPVRSMIACI